MKIAVCLSGQPRTVSYAIGSILHHYSGENYSFDFFCHSWNYNTYKRKLEDGKLDFLGQPVFWEADELVDEKELLNTLLKFNPQKIKIHSKSILAGMWPWKSLFYSATYANMLKKQYEVENNFRYDLVIKMRYDIIFDPRFKFMPHPWACQDNYQDIFVDHAARMAFEYNCLNLSDTVFYGSSLAMDNFFTLYKYLIEKNQNRRDDDLECLGPGTLMFEYGSKLGIRFCTPDTKNKNICQTVFRKEVIDKDPIHQFQEIREFNNSLYRL